MQEKQRGGAREEAKSRRVRERLQERGIVQGTECLRELVVRGEEERGRMEVMEGKRSLEGEGKKGEQADEWALKTPDKGIQQPPSSAVSHSTGGELPLIRQPLPTPRQRGFLQSNEVSSADLCG